MVDRVGGHGEDGAGGKGMRSDRDGRAGGDKAREAEGGGGVDAESFGDDLLEAMRLCQ